MENLNYGEQIELIKKFARNKFRLISLSNSDRWEMQDLTAVGDILCRLRYNAVADSLEMGFMVEGACRNVKFNIIFVASTVNVFTFRSYVSKHNALTTALTYNIENNVAKTFTTTDNYSKHVLQFDLGNCEKQDLIYFRFTQGNINNMGISGWWVDYD